MEERTKTGTVSNSELNEPLGAPVGYVCEALFTVRRAEDSVGYSGFIPMVRLPVSLIGKTVKVIIEECT